VPAHRALTAALLAAALGAAGCGSADTNSAEDFKGERQAVAQTVEDIQKAGRDGDEQQFCDDLLAAPVVARLRAQPGAKNDCANALGDSLEDADSFDMTATSVTVNGNRATAVVKSDAGDDDRTDTLTFVREGGNWKLASIGR
jgi:hypothetical protein